MVHTGYTKYQARVGGDYGRRGGERQYNDAGRHGGGRRVAGRGLGARRLRATPVQLESAAARRRGGDCGLRRILVVVTASRAGRLEHAVSVYICVCAWVCVRG